MNERGFFTIVGLCLLLVAAISIKGIHEFETNYTYGTNESLIENELQNIADNALIAEINGENYTPTVTDRLIDLKIETPQPQESTFGQFTRVYSDNTYKDIPVKNDDGTEKQISGTVYMSVASCKSPFIVGRIYRRSLAYVTDNVIHFMNDVPKLKPVSN